MTEQARLTDEQVAEALERQPIVLAGHRECDGPLYRDDGMCSACGTRWPCAAVRDARVMLQVSADLSEARADAVHYQARALRAENRNDDDNQTIVSLQADLSAAKSNQRDGRYLPTHAVMWMVVNDQVCRKQHTADEPCVLERPFWDEDRARWFRDYDSIAKKLDAAEAALYALQNAAREAVEVLKAAWEWSAGFPLQGGFASDSDQRAAEDVYQRASTACQALRSLLPEERTQEDYDEGHAEHLANEGRAR